jgi:hypothetical protein
MYISITIEAEGKKYNLSVDERQKPSAVYNILAERGLANKGKAPEMYKSELLGEWVRADLSLKEQGIKSGDLLKVQGA